MELAEPYASDDEKCTNVLKCPSRSNSHKIDVICTFVSKQNCGRSNEVGRGMTARSNTTSMSCNFANVFRMTYASEASTWSTCSVGICSRALVRFVYAPRKKLSIIVSCATPSAINKSTRWLPIKPAPPVTSTCLPRTVRLSLLIIHLLNST